MNHLKSGLCEMSGSSTSTPPSIKSAHRIAKSRGRRKRLDLQCGCSYYFHTNCYNYGFTHRGLHYCNSSTEWRSYLGIKKSIVFEDDTRWINDGVDRRDLQHPDPIQPQSEKITGNTQMLPQLQDLDDTKTSRDADA